MINNQKSCENKVQDNTSAKIDEEILLLKNKIVQHLEKKNFSFELGLKVLGSSKSTK